MAARNPVVPLALVLVAGLAVAFWIGFGPGEDAGPGPGGPGGHTPEAGKNDPPGGTLQGDAGQEAGKTTEGDEREQVAADPSARARLAVTGRLVRSDGSVLADATLRHQRLAGLVITGAPPRPDLSKAEEVRTDKEGRFRIFAKPSGTHLLALDDKSYVLQRGFGLGGMTFRVQKVDHDLGDLTVFQQAQVSGQVVDAAGKPVAGISVSRSRTGNWFTAFAAGNKTDKEGRFGLDGFKPGEHTLLTRSAEFLPAEKKIELNEGEHLENVVIPVKPGGFILGTVVNDVGTPVEGADVVASRTRQVDPQMKITSFVPGESTKTDASGRFRLSNLDTPKATLRVSKRGLAAEMVRDVVVGTADLTVEMNRNGAVEGVLVDEKNKPVQGSRVYAVGSRMILIEDLMPANANDVTTDARGRFRIENVEPGRRQIRARGNNHRPARKRVDVRPGETTRGVRLQALSGTSIEVTVVDAKGAPVSDANVTVHSIGSGDNIMPSPRPRGGPRRERRVGYRFSRNRDGEDGLRLLGGARILGKGKTDARGKVTIGGLPAGPAEVKAKHKELAMVEPSKLELPPQGRTNARLAMRRGGFAELTAVDAAGKPIPNAKVKVVGPMGSGDKSPSENITCDDEGKARVGPLAAGDYAALLRAEPRPIRRGNMSMVLASGATELKDSKASFRVREGDTCEATLQKPVLTTVRGTVRDAKGPVRGVEVALVGEDDVQIRLPFGGGLKDSTDKDGGFEIKDVASGKYKMTWGRRSALVHSEEDVVLAKNQAELVKELKIAGAVIKLRAFDPAEGEPIEDAEITLARVGSSPGGERRSTNLQIRMIGIQNNGGGPQRVDMSAGNSRAFTDEDGNAILKDVPAGSYELTVKHKGYKTHREDVLVQEDASLDLGTKQMAAGGAIRGSVDFSDNPSMRLAEVEMRPMGTKDAETEIARDGRFRFDGLAAGKYSVRARRLNESKWGPTQEVEVKPGRTARARLTLPKK